MNLVHYIGEAMDIHVGAYSRICVQVKTMEVSLTVTESWPMSNLHLSLRAAAGGCGVLSAEKSG